MPERLRDLLGLTAAMLLGVVAFLIYVGWPTLIPTNIAWLDAGDRAMHQLGWMFYRQGAWGLPPGDNPLLGIEISSSIGLVDGLPLFAIPFKLIATWLPQPFQYWGYWLLLSFALQAMFAWRLARELDAGRVVALIAAAFALITPAYLFRVPLHMALSGHWVILAALFLYVRREPPRLWMWPLLVGLTSAIHITLLAMVLSLWLAALAQRLWLKRTHGRLLAGEATMTVAVTLAVLWAVGFFYTGSLGSQGYGSYKLNVLWPILTYGWSQIMPDLPHTRLDYEGISFLGVGIIALLALATLSGALSLRSLASRRWLPLVLMVLALMLFAFSKSISLGATDLFTIPMPAPIEMLGAAFRSTGRFVWPILYLITIVAVVLVGRRFRPFIAVPILLLALGAQAVDSGPRATQFTRGMQQPATRWSIPLRSELWARAATAGYDRVRTIPLQTGYSALWKAVGYYAITHGMDTDTALLARVDAVRLKALRRKGRAVLASGAFEPRTIYILDVPSALSAAAHLQAGDLLAWVDHRIVFIRGGHALGAGLDLLPVIPTD